MTTSPTPSAGRRATVVLDSQYGPLTAFADDFINSQIVQFGNHTRPEFAFGTAVIDDTMDVFDLGGHIGTFSLAALPKLGPGRRILAVEGNPRTFELLGLNMAAHGRGAVTCVNACIGAEGAHAWVEDPGNSGANWLRRVEEGEGIGCLSIDALVAAHFAPAYIKIDIEGGEAKALAASDHVREARPLLYMEVSRRQLANHGSTVEELATFLSGLGYVAYRNVGDRNARHDLFRVAREDDVAGEGNKGRLFDILCAPQGHPMQAALDRAAGRA